MKSFKLFAALFALIVFLVSCGTSEQSFIDEPEVGDVYQIEYHNIDGHELAYQLVKVRAIDGENLTLSPNCMYYHDKVYCMTAPDYFNSKTAYTKTKTEVRKMYVDKTIVEVFRYYDEDCLGNDK